MESSLTIAAYLALFFSVGLAFVFVNLLVGRFLRSHDPHPEKQEIYECGEPSIGSSFVQFDLRFYVIALVFIVFDVEVAFLFPVATVFGKSANLAETEVAVQRTADGIELSPTAKALYQELGVRQPEIPQSVPASLEAAALSQFGTSGEQLDVVDRANLVVHSGSRQLLWWSSGAIGLFFVILIIGFAYEWKEGNLDWVRAMPGSRTVVDVQRQPAESIGLTLSETSQSV